MFHHAPHMLSDSSVQFRVDPARYPHAKSAGPMLSGTVYPVAGAASADTSDWTQY
jgi:hypothetical protein